MILLNSKTCCVFTEDMSKLLAFAILKLFQVVGGDTVESTGQVLLAKLHFSCCLMCNLKLYMYNIKYKITYYLNLVVFCYITIM